VDEQVAMPIPKPAGESAPSSSTLPPRSDAQRLQVELPRILGLRDLVLLVIGTVIGSGIFLVPGDILKPLGSSVGLAMMVWLTGGVLSLLGALTYGELSAMKPHAGGLYIYLRDCFGPFVAFLFGWTLFFVISSGSVATLAVAFSNYLGEFLPLTPATAKLVSVAVIGVIAVINVRGTRQSANIQSLATALKVLAILAMGTALLWLGKNPVHLAAGPQSASSTGSLFSGFGLAMISVLWAYEGWQYATFSAGETLNAKRDYPLAFLIGSAALIFIYLFANVGYLAAIGAQGAVRSNRVAATAVAEVIHPAAAKLVTVTILISIFSAAHSVILTSPRVYYAMAKDGLFFKRLAGVHRSFGTPSFAVIAAAAWSAVLAATGTFQQLLTYVIFIGWMFYALAAASVFVYRRRHPNADRPYRVPGYPFTPLLFIAAAVALVLNTIVTQPQRAAVGLGIVLLGAPAYAIWRRRTAIATPANLDRAGAGKP
jgi:basic amino acid/polyamine antiporter, APA family